MPLLNASLPIARSSSLVLPRQEGGSMELGPNRGVFDYRSLLGGVMGSDAAGQYFAHRQLVFFSTHWMMWISAQRRLRKSLRSTMNPKTGNLRRLGQTSSSGVLSSFPSSIALSSRMTVAYSRVAKFKVMVRCRVQTQAWPHFMGPN